MRCKTLKADERYTSDQQLIATSILKRHFYSDRGNVFLSAFERRFAIVLNIYCRDFVYVYDDI